MLSEDVPTSQEHAHRVGVVSVNALSKKLPAHG
jgi:hypothetical protein